MQYSFGFYQQLDPRRPKYPERLFFALLPDDETSCRLDQMRRSFVNQNNLRETFLLQERFHLSLYLVGNFKRIRDGIVYAATLAARSIVMPAFEVTLHSIQSFAGAPKRNRPLVCLAHSDALPSLNEALGTAIRWQGFRASSDFTPHVTMSYGSKPVSVQKIEPIRFIARDFVLIHSEVGLSRYHVRGRWPLRG